VCPHKNIEKHFVRLFLIFVERQRHHNAFIWVRFLVTLHFKIIIMWAVIYLFQKQQRVFIHIWLEVQPLSQIYLNVHRCTFRYIPCGKVYMTYVSSGILLIWGVKVVITYHETIYHEIVILLLSLAFISIATIYHYIAQPNSKYSPSEKEEFALKGSICNLCSMHPRELLFVVNSRKQITM